MSNDIARYEKTADIVNNIKGTTFNLVYDDSRDIVWKDKTIKITAQDTLANLEHSLSHILYDSKAPTNSTILELAKTDKGYDGSLLFKEIFYTLEAERVESNWGEVYYGSHQEFERQRNERGKRDEGDLNPIRALQFARNGSTDRLNSTEYESATKYINDVHGMDCRVSLKLAIDYYNRYVKDWLDTQITKVLEEKLENYIRDTKAYNETKIKELEQCKDYYSQEYAKSLHGELDSLDNKTIHDMPVYEWEMANILKESCTRYRQERHERSPKKIAKNTVNTIQGADMEQLTKRARKSTSKINNMLKEYNRPKRPVLDNLATNLYIADRPESEYDIDYNTSHRLRKLINTVRANKSQAYDMYGNMLDIDEYIQDIINTKQGLYWEDEEYSQGLAIAIGIDCSGSMPNSAMKTCRDMCATILYATQYLKDIEITFVPWSTSNDRHDLYANEFTALDDIKYISKNDKPQNANDLAHQYLDRIVSKSNADKKVIIMMTDGEPFCWGIDRTALFANTIEAIRQSKMRGHLVYGIFLNFNDNEERTKLMQGMYRDHFVSCNNIADASKTVIELTRNHILRSI